MNCPYHSNEELAPYSKGNWCYMCNKIPLNEHHIVTFNGYHDLHKYLNEPNFGLVKSSGLYVKATLEEANYAFLEIVNDFYFRMIKNTQGNIPENTIYTFSATILTHAKGFSKRREIDNRLILAFTANELQVR